MSQGSREHTQAEQEPQHEEESWSSRGGGRRKCSVRGDSGRGTAASVMTVPDVAGAMVALAAARIGSSSEPSNEIKVLGALTSAPWSH